MSGPLSPDELRKRLWQDDQGVEREWLALARQ
jgi:hypothetical protein